METNPTYKASFLLISFLFFFNCSEKQETQEVVSLTGKTMGTTFNIKIVPSPKTTLDINTIEKEINDLLNEVNRQMSTYLSDSEISQFNLSRDTSWFSVSKDFAYVVEQALKVSKESKGAFDVTVGPLVSLQFLVKTPCSR
jgi:thiamine biosynthesis lipoprotein